MEMTDERLLYGDASLMSIYTDTELRYEYSCTYIQCRVKTFQRLTR